MSRVGAVVVPSNFTKLGGSFTHRYNMWLVHVRWPNVLWLVGTNKLTFFLLSLKNFIYIVSVLDWLNSTGDSMRFAGRHLALSSPSQVISGGDETWLDTDHRSNKSKSRKKHARCTKPVNHHQHLREIWKPMATAKRVCYLNKKMKQKGVAADLYL